MFILLYRLVLVGLGYGIPWDVLLDHNLVGLASVINQLCACIQSMKTEVQLSLFIGWLMIGNGDNCLENGGMFKWCFSLVIRLCFLSVYMYIISCIISWITMDEIKCIKMDLDYTEHGLYQGFWEL